MQILSRLRGLVAPTTGDQPLRLADGGGGGGGGSPLTTKGDLFGFDTGGNRVPVGANGKVLTADSTAALGVSYQSPVSGSVIVSDGSTTVPTAATLLFSGASVTNLGSGVAGVSVSGGGGGAGLVYGQPDFVPPAGTFAWTNQGANSVASIYSGAAQRITIPPGATTDSLYANTVAPGTFTAIACFNLVGYLIAGFSRFGIAWLDSSTGRSQMFAVDVRSNPIGLSSYQFNSGFSFTTSIFSSVTPADGAQQLVNVPVWLKVVRDSSNNITFWVSTDGESWASVTSSADTSNWVANPDTIGLVMLNFGTSGNLQQEMAADLLSWSVGP
jgi:hypothetical protein